MGALRTAELWPFCTLGVGWVFAFYRDGVITGDDEVPSHRPGRQGVPATERAAGEKDIYRVLSGGIGIPRGWWPGPECNLIS
ncbi:hypothetical protein C8A03DRAFT_15165 [Achaetomium macrosporum]|uniref:TfuA-like core domain-containing protein n=1 Tax=Achaetomium macrosporum TaxID=79813 RepID=A0AAN7H785_9PEZI|nr:hypothetical protein C8A03DRAFT_15165 [Achaetomium macrosporum]